MIQTSRHALLTDLYELTMAASYFREEMQGDAVFSLFIRKYPPDRAYFISAGLEDVVRYLEGLSFSQSDLAYLEGTQLFQPPFLDFLRRLRFTGQVRAIPEGRLFFRDEPVLEVRAPIIEAQLAETFVINAINLGTMLATKAARCLVAARGRPLVDFAFRRTQGIEAGLCLARACYMVGFAATSNVQAGKELGIPVSGTMAHSYVTAFTDELESFRAFARAFPAGTTLLIDTFDTLAGAHKAVQVARELAARGSRLRAVRLDSGDLLALSVSVRKILDDASFPEVQIFASGGLDEYEIASLLGRGAPIDAFGVGTKLGVSADAPYMDIAYKLVEYAGRPALKLSPGKVTLAGAKQVFRFRHSEGSLLSDTIGLADERLPGSEPLLQTIMEGGRLLQPLPTLEEARRRFQDEFAALPDDCKRLQDPAAYPVDLSARLQALQERAVGEAERRELGKG